MVQKLISDLNDLKIRINNNINYNSNAKIVARNLIDGIIKIMPISNFKGYGDINKVLNSFGNMSNRYESKKSIHSRINYIKKEITLNRSVNSEVTKYTNNLLNKVKGL